MNAIGVIQFSYSHGKFEFFSFLTEKIHFRVCFAFAEKFLKNNSKFKQKEGSEKSGNGIILIAPRLINN